MSAPDLAGWLSRALEQIETDGVLMQSDAALPSVAGMIAGEPIHGSWWGHPIGGTIYNTLVALDDHAEIAAVKLIDAKVAYVHRRHWPALVTMATSGEGWQLRRLAAPSGVLLTVVNGMGECRLDELSLPEIPSPKGLAAAARDLERRLLVVGWQIHTERGAHAKCLATWDRWMERRGLFPEEMSIDDARGELDGVLVRLNEKYDARAKLPWW